MKVCHVSSVHCNNDSRIFIKECCSLSNANYDVFFVVEGDSFENNGCHIVGIGNPPSSKRKRIFSFSKKAYKKALELDCEVYHLHDPELLLYAKKLKRKGKIVIFDSHEDVSAQIMDKEWIPKILRHIVSKLFSVYQGHVLKRIDGIVAATETIGNLLNKYNTTVVVNNYPKFEDIKYQTNPFSNRPRIIGYAGSLDNNRGLQVVIESLKSINGTLKFASNEFIENDKIINCGKLNRDGVNNLYKESRLGIVLYKPLANHINAQPIKMFEYMAAGLPVVASNFPLWRRIIEENNCGICVNPLDSIEISNACNKLLDNPVWSEQLGKNGYNAIVSKYNWANEEKKLLDFYKKIVSL